MNENIQNEIYTLSLPEPSEWKCYLFGSKSSQGIVFVPRKGQEPNWFWRKMQFLILGNKWVKNER